MIAIIIIVYKLYKIMKFNPHLQKNTSTHNKEANIQRKRSLFKPNQPQISPNLQLPRFYSSDQKIKRKNIIIQTDQHDNINFHHHKHPTQHIKKQSTKYSKTQKNQTPNKGQSALNKVKLIQQKLGQVMMKNIHSQLQKGKHRQKKIDYKDILHVERSEDKIKEIYSNHQSNQNKIKYKITLQKKTETEQRVIQSVQTEAAQPKNHPKSIRQSKVLTEEGQKNPLKQKSKPVIRIQPMFNEYVTETKAPANLKQQKTRTLSTFQSVMKSKCKLNQQEKEHLKAIQAIFKKTIKDYQNLDNPENYIVCEKNKWQKKYYQILQTKHQLQYKTSLILTRLLFFLCAHYILESTSTKILIPLFNKMLQNHEVIMLILGINNDKSKPQKYFSVNKYSTKDLIQLNHQFGQLAVQNRGNNLKRNNQFVKHYLHNLCNANDFLHSQLFINILEQEMVVDSLANVSEMDKKLKWEVLKMPTSPFLPLPNTNHTHYLILDLDETLIHFNPTRETYHIRPYASQFLQHLSKYYELTVFTAATKEYADDIINQIDKGNYISHRLYRNHLTFLMGESLKDISMLGRDLHTTLIVDNLQTNFRLHPQNGILIKSWYGNDSDNILPKLQNLLIRIMVQFPHDLRKGTSLYSNFINRQIAQRTHSYKIKYDI